MAYAEILHRIYAATVADDVARSFAILLLGLFAFAILSHLGRAKARSLAGFARAAPTTMTSVGVLGTFVGIFLGLLDFDVQRIDAAVPQLLDGLKIAFVTSILGISYTVLFKAFESILPIGSSESGITPEDVYNELRGIHSESSQLVSAIGGEGESSVVTQLQKLRTTITDGNTELLAEFRQFVQTMADNNSKALIAALEQVMRDFNTKINEQFGDNFKRLNDAVQELVAWQDKYRIQMDQLQNELAKTFDGIRVANDSLTSIAVSAAAIPTTMGALKTLIENIQVQIDDLDAHLTALASLKADAQDAFPMIESNIKKLTDQFSDSVVTAGDEIRTAVSQMHSSFENTVSESNEIPGKQLRVLDEQIQDEVKRVVELMGGHLASLSNKFVEDYTPLTDRLQRLVSIAERHAHG